MDHVISYTIVDSPLGRLLMGATAQGICAVRWGESDDALAGELSRDYPDAELERDAERLRRWIVPLLDAVAGGNRSVDLPLDVPATTFQRRVWETVRRIPVGETRAYGVVAEAAGHPGAARAVARACAANPAALVIPCHRVVRGDGGMGGYRWGRERKRRLLAREAIDRAAWPQACPARRRGGSLAAPPSLREAADGDRRAALA